MNIRKILYATDFSPNSDLALECASSLAAEQRAALIIAHVDDTTPGLVFGEVGYGYLPEVDAIALEEYQRLLAIVPTRDGVACQHHFLRGTAAQGILHIAEEEKVDLIVLGTHGRTGLQALLMGNVAETVVRSAKCPVLTVRQPAEKSESTTVPAEIASPS